MGGTTLASSDGGRYAGSASNAYSPNLSRPGKRAPGGKRTALKIALCLLLPPIGVLYLWRTGSFQLRGRVLLTALASLVLSLWFLPTMRGAELNVVLPQPVAPAGATRAAQSDVVSALSNIEQLLLAQEAAEAAQIGEGEMAPAPGEGAELSAADAFDAANEAIYNTIVYSVRNNAKYYHAAASCDGQTNRVELTVREAIAKGLGACAKCNPAVPQ